MPKTIATDIWRMLATVFGRGFSLRQRIGALFLLALCGGMASCGGWFFYDHAFNPHNMERLDIGDCVRVDALRPDHEPADHGQKRPEQLLPMFLIRTNGDLSDFTEAGCAQPDALLVVINQGRQGCSTTNGLWTVNSIEYQTHHGGRHSYTNGTCLAPIFQAGRCYQASPERGPWRALDCADPRAVFQVDKQRDEPGCGDGSDEPFWSPRRNGIAYYCLKKPGPR